jgi:hypothetical protein
MLRQSETALSAEQESKLRLYRRLWLTRIDLEETRETVDELIRQRLPLPRSKKPSPLLQALTTAFVVTYARPFITSRGQSVAEKTVPGSCLRVLTAVERRSHEALLNIRNHEVAHSDADILDMSIEVFPHGDGGVCRATRTPFRQAELRHVRRIVEKLEAEVERRCEELRHYLPHNVWM